MLSKRSRYWAIGVTAGGLLLVGTALVAANRPTPSGFETKVVGCDLSSPGTARVGYQVTNHDGSEHAYRVLVTVATGSSTLGWGVSLVSHVGADESATAWVPVTLTGTQATAHCSVKAEVYDGHSGHA